MALTEQDAARLTEKRFRSARPFQGKKVARIPASQLPPGPRWPAVLQSVGLLRFRHQFVPWLHQRYGDVFTVRLIPGSQPLVLFTKPEHTREIFAGDPEIFHAGKGNAILGPIMGEHSLLLQDSTEHARARKLITPAFAGKVMKGYAELVTRIARDEVASWRPGEEFRSLDRMNRLTLEVILRVVFGVSDEQRLAALRPCVNRTVDISPAILLGWGWPRLQRLGPWKATVENQRQLDRLMYAEISQRRGAPDLAERTDVLSRLIRVRDGGDALSDVELRDQLVTLLLAGHETTATALAWALYELGRDPAQLARARQAAADGDDGWLEAVMKESMRLHPVIPMVVRHLMKPVTVGGIDLPAGATIGPSILIAHQRPDNHPDPERFRPERFLEVPEGEPSGTERPAHDRHRAGPPVNTWIPFGGGVRRCIGAGFSLMEGVVILREVLSAYEITALGEDVPKVRNITSVPRNGARIRVS